MKQRVQKLVLLSLAWSVISSDVALAQQEVGQERQDVVPAFEPTQASAPVSALVSAQKSGINAFVNYVWESSPSVAESEARVVAAEAAQRAAARWRYNPELGYSGDDKDGAKKTNIVGVTQTIDWSGKSVSSGKTAGFELLAVQAQRDNVRQKTALGVLSSLANYGAAEDILKLAVERSHVMERFAGLAEKGFRAGDIDLSEYNLARLALSEALMSQADAETMLAQSKQEMDSSIGFPLESGFVLPVLPASLPEIVGVKNEDQILMKLPHLRAMRSREEAARSVIAQARKDRLPDPTLGVSGGKDEGDNVIGLSVSVPLYVFNSFGAEVEQANQEAIAQARAVQNALYAAKARLQASRRAYQLSKKAWVNWQKNGAQALAEQTDILDRKFKVGDLSATDYLVQIEQALSTEVAATQLHSKVWQSWFSWLDASGRVEQWIKNSGE